MIAGTKMQFSPGFVASVLMLLMIESSGYAQTAQWRGPNRNGVYPDTGLLKEWPENGPPVIWVAEGMGRGYSSAVATEDRIYTTGTVDSTEFLISLDLQGNVMWKTGYGKSWEKSFPDARSTPTIDGDRAYVISGLHDLACLNAMTGEILWKIDLHEKYQSSWDMFGISESVLLVDDRIVVTTGGPEAMVIALDKMNGKLIWKSKSLNMKCGNLSPVLITRANKRYVIAASQTHVLSVDLETGEILWTYHYNYLSEKEENVTILANSPVYREPHLWISNGWDTKSVMLEVAEDGRSVQEIIADHTFDNQNHGVVLLDTLLFGSNFTGRNSGKWVCMNWNSGEILWLEEFHNKGPIISADGMLYCLEEKRGNMALAVASGKEFEIVSSFRILEGRGAFWARPAIYHGMLLVRHGDALIAYNIKKP